MERPHLKKERERLVRPTERKKAVVGRAGESRTGLSRWARERLPQVKKVMSGQRLAGHLLGFLPSPTARVLLLCGAQFFIGSLQGWTL
jgi:hypothetical protein